MYLSLSYTGLLVTKLNLNERYSHHITDKKELMETLFYMSYFHFFLLHVILCLLHSVFLYEQDEK